MRARGAIDYSTACIKEGERGTVVEEGVDPPMLEYGVSVHWDEHHAGLSWWDNETLLVGDDILPLERVREWPSLKSIMLHPVSIASFVVLMTACEVADALGVF